MLLVLILAFFSVAGWIYTAVYYHQVLRKTPRLESSSVGRIVKVSVILPARNEQDYLEDCLRSLLNQSYPNLEIIAADDSSTDETAQIMQTFATVSPLVKTLSVPPTPPGWTGKTWACHTGYQKSSGELLLFTDADTVFHPDLIRDAVAQLFRENLAALTLIPRITSEGHLNRAVQPILGVIMAVGFSPLTVNDPKSPWAFFWGSFILTTRPSYREVGGHERVKADLVEDRALGRLTKKAGHRVQMASGVDHLSALWTRRNIPPWRSLQRVITPSLKGNMKAAVGFILATTLLFLSPYLILPYAALELVTSGPEPSVVLSLLLALTSVALMVCCSILEAHRRLGIHPLYGLGTPLAAIVVWGSLVASMLRRVFRGSVEWKGRRYPQTSEGRHS